jgi:spore germination protein GerM
VNRRQVLGLVLLVTAFAGCGVRGESSPTKLDDIALPAETVPREARPDGEGPSTVVYFVQEEHLTAVERDVPATLSGAIRSVLQGPRATELASGLRSAIPAGTTLSAVDLSDGTATIDLSDDFRSVVGPEQVLALAQLVYSATEITGVSLVRFSIEGDPIDAARGDGSLSSTAVGRSDYANAVQG